MQRAADYLDKPGLLALPMMEGDNLSKLNQSQTSFNSSKTQGRDFLSMNKDQAKSFNPYKKALKCD